MADSVQTVMVVDDDEALRESVADLLEDEGHQVVRAGDGASALAALRAGTRPDVILLDLTMRGLDGWQFREQQLADSTLAAIPVIVMTATRDVRGMTADEILYKPVTVERLLDSLRRHDPSRRAPADPGSVRATAPSPAPVDRPYQVPARQSLAATDEKFRVLVDQLQAGIAQTDLTGRFVLVNERFRELVGRTDTELAQLRMQDITHPDDLPSNIEPFGRLVRDGTPFVIEKRYVKPDGSIVWVQNSVSRIDDRDGVATGVAAVTVDITRRRFAEQALKESEARFRNMADHAPVMVWIADADARCTYLSKSWYAFTGQAPETALGVGWLDAVHPDDRAAAYQTFVAANEKREPLRLDYRLRRHDGVYRWAIDSAHPRFGADGEFCGYIGSVIDITERKENELALERTVRFSEMFVGVLGHDLRNPLSAITTAANLLEIRADTDRIATPVLRILASAHRMERMISQLLDFTSIRLGQGFVLSPSPVDLAEVASAVVDELKPMVTDAFVIDAVGNLAGTLDRDRLSQMLSNVLANAAQHGTAGGPIQVLLDGSHAGAMRIEVRNDGVIPARALPVLFEPFATRVLDKPRGGSSGLGLGLFITHAIVTAHGGKLSVQSSSEEGTLVTIDLPRHLGVPATPLAAVR